VEVPVMLSLVALANRTQGHFAEEAIVARPESVRAG